MLAPRQATNSTSFELTRRMPRRSECHGEKLSAWNRPSPSGAGTKVRYEPGNWMPQWQTRKFNSFEVHGEREGEEEREVSS